ncbi:MAG: four helix bundle protein [Nitrospirae bacterium]|nr:four helix bundle protein [Nitrospirota bacterium]
MPFAYAQMARYEHLPIYKKAMDLAVYIENVVKGFSRYHKYSIGADLRNLSRGVVTLIISANSREEKLPALLTLRDAIEELKVMINICKEVKAFRSFTAFQTAAESIVDIGRQSEGWIRSVKQSSRAAAQ